MLKNFLDTAEAEVKSLTTLYIEVVSFLAFIMSYFKSSWKFSHAKFAYCLYLVNLQGRNADSLSLYFGEDPARCPFEQGKRYICCHFSCCIIIHLSSGKIPGKEKSTVVWLINNTLLFQYWISVVRSFYLSLMWRLWDALFMSFVAFVRFPKLHLSWGSCLISSCAT